MFEPNEFIRNDVEIAPGDIVTFTLTGWFGWLYRITGGPHSNAWRIGSRDAYDEFYKRVNEAHFAHDE